MPRGFGVLQHPEKYSKKQVQRALKRKGRKEPSIIELAMAHHEAKIPHTNGAKQTNATILHFNREANEYYYGGLKINMFDPDNAAEVVRRFNSGDA